MPESDTQPLQTGQDCAGCPGCVQRDAIIAARDQTIADQAKVNERLSAQLKWLGLDDNALSIVDGYAHYKRSKQNEPSWPKYAAFLAPLIRRHGGLPCLQLDEERWADHLAVRLTEKCGRWLDRKPSASQLDLELAHAKMFMQHLVRKGLLPRNPLVLAKRRTKDAQNRRETCLPREDIDRLMAGADVLAVDGTGHRDDRRVLMFRAFAAVTFGAMLRLNEVRPIRRDRIVGGLLKLSAKSTKGKSERTVPIPDYAIAAIEAVPPLDHEPYVFSRRRKGKVVMVQDGTLRAWFHQVCEATGVDSRALDGERVVPHTLRHSGATHADAQGAHPLDLQRTLGHKSLSTTERYLHRDDELAALRIRGLMERKGPQRASSTDGETVDSTFHEKRP